MCKRLIYLISLVLVLGLAGNASAAIAFDAVSTGVDGGGDSTISWSHTIGSGSNRILIVAPANEDNSEGDMAITSIKYNNVSMTAVSGGSSYQDPVKAYLYYMLEANLPSAGAYTIEIIYADTVSDLIGGAISLSGVAQEAPEAVATNSNPDENVISTNITTQSDNAWVVDVVCHSRAENFITTTGGMTERYDVDSGAHTAAGATKAVASAGSTTMSWEFDGSADPIVHVLAAFAPADGAPSPPGKATNPSPANSATNVSTTANLSWSAGSGATSHDVYFGTDSTPDATEFKGNQTATTYEPGTMSTSTTHYWRIDEKNATGTATGDIWSFTTEAAPSPPGQATSPSPSHQATGVSTTANLSWSAGSGATSHDVYFGTDSTPDATEFKANQTATTYEPGTMANSTTHYWRIDEKNATGTTTGDVWSFTTETEAGPEPNIVGWWKFDEASGGVAYDSSGYDNDGDISGATWTTGILDGALSFNGGGDVYIADSPEVEYSTESFSLSFWLKASGTQQSALIQNGTFGSEYEGASGRRYHVYSHADGYFRFAVDDNVTKTELNLVDTAFFTGDWVHVTAIRDTSADKLKLYCDGKAKANGNDYTGDIASPGEGLYIANAPASGYGFTGQIDDVRIYDSALAGGEVANLYYDSGSFGMAWDADPADNAVSVSTSKDLSWSAGAGATSHDVYFGTDATPDAGEFKGNQTATTYDAGTMTASTTYYWRIDEVSAGGTVTGDVWAFSTGTTLDLRIDCTEAALREALGRVAGANGGTITFNCSSSNINVEDRIYFHGDNMVLDGEDRNLTFYYTGPDNCSQTEGQDHLIEIQGDDNVIKNFTLMYFPDGLHVTSGYDNLIENITWPVICEDAVTNNGRGYEAFGTIIRGCYFEGGDDKAIMVNNGGGCTIEHCTFVDTIQSIRCTGAKDALYIIQNCLFDDIHRAIRSANDSSGVGHTFIFRNNIINDPEAEGVLIYNDSKGIIRNNEFTGGDWSVRAFDQAKIRLEYNDIQNGNIGVDLDDDVDADLGGGSVYINGSSTSSEGHNLIKGFSNNKSLVNGTGVEVKAEYNEWNNSTVEAVLDDDVSGSADVDPLSWGGTVDPVGPQAPWN